LDAAIKQLDETKKLRRQGFVSEAELREAELKKTTAQDVLSRASDQYNKEIYALANKVKQLDVERSLAQESSTKTELETNNKRALLKAAAQSALDRLHSLYGEFEIREGTIILKAVSDQVVSYVNDVEKQVAPGAILLKLMTSTSGLYASSAVKPQHIGSVRTGLAAVLKVSAFPYYHWGVVRGEVSSLSITPDDAGNYPFEIHITDAGTISHYLQIGMDGELNVLVDERPLFGYVFEKIIGKN
jgi:adhesin transport system membrane fusion protein